MFIKMHAWDTKNHGNNEVMNIVNFMLYLIFKCLYNQICKICISILLQLISIIFRCNTFLNLSNVNWLGLKLLFKFKELFAVVSSAHSYTADCAVVKGIMERYIHNCKRQNVLVFVFQLK